MQTMVPTRKRTIEISLTDDVRVGMKQRDIAVTEVQRMNLRQVKKVLLRRFDGRMFIECFFGESRNPVDEKLINKAEGVLRARIITRLKNIFDTQVLELQ